MESLNSRQRLQLPVLSLKTCPVLRFWTFVFFPSDMVHGFENRVQPMEQQEDGSYSDCSVSKVRGSALNPGQKVEQSKSDQSELGGVVFILVN